MYLNRITLLGFLGSDAEVRTANNSTLAVLSLATKSSYKDKKSGGQDTKAETAMSDQSVRAIWLKRIEPRPAEFLRSRFLFQLEQKP